MKRPDTKDFERTTHDCWGVTDTEVNVYAYARALNDYIDYLEKKIDYSNVVPNFMSIEESIENIKKSFQFEEDKTLMNKLIEELLKQNKDE
jgi:phage FluMu protein Com